MRTARSNEAAVIGNRGISVSFESLERHPLFLAGAFTRIHVERVL